MKQFEIKKLLDNKKFDTAVIIVNCVIIGILVVILIFMYLNAGETEKPVQNSGDVDVQFLIDEADAGMLEVYRVLLENSDFDLGDGVVFHFGEDGAYSGYFDADNRDVSGYHYAVTAGEKSDCTLTISNEDNSKYVEYTMSFDMDGNILLKYPGMEQCLVLKYWLVWWL